MSLYFFFLPAFVLLFSLQLIGTQRTLIRETKEGSWQRIISLWRNLGLVKSLMLLILHCITALLPSFTHDCFLTRQASRATPCHCSQPHHIQSQCRHITHSDTFWKVCCCWGSKWHSTQSMRGKRMNWIKSICRLTVLGMFLKCLLFVAKTQENTPPAAVCFYISSEWKCFGCFVHHFMPQLSRNSTWLFLVFGESLILAKRSALLDNEIKGAIPQSSRPSL